MNETFMANAVFWMMTAGFVIMAIVILSWAVCQFMRWNYYRKQNRAAETYLSGLDERL